MSVIILAFLILLSPLARLTLTAQPIPPPQGQGYMWCLFCRSDKNHACINKGAQMANEFTKECNNATMTEFTQDLIHDKPTRPVAAPRQSGVNWGCYRVYTTDESFTMRSCIELSGSPPLDEECTTCKFDGFPAKCCICAYPNCNDKNSLADRFFTDNSLTVAIKNVLTICALALFN